MTLAEFKTWRLQNPSVAKTLKHIIITCRTSTATLKSHPGYWGAYPIRTWCTWIGISRRTFFRHLKELEGAKLLDRAGFHKFSGNTNHSYLRPTSLAKSLMSGRHKDPETESTGGTLEGTLDGTLACPKNGTLGGTLDGTLQPQTLQHFNDTTIQPVAIASEAVPESAINCKKDDMAKIKGLLTSEVVSKLRKPGISSLDQVHVVWTKAFSEVTGWGFVPKLTIKHQKMLKTAANNLPEGKAGEVVYFAVKNWELFSNFAAKCTGLYSVPEAPTVEFFAKHAVIAANMWLANENGKSAAASPSPAVELPAQEPAPSYSDDFLDAMEG